MWESLNSTNQSVAAPGIPHQTPPGPASTIHVTNTITPSAGAAVALLDPDNTSSDINTDQTQSQPAASSAPPSSLLIPFSWGGSMPSHTDTYPPRSGNEVPDIDIQAPSAVSPEFPEIVPTQDNSGNYLYVMEEITKQRMREELKKMKRLKKELSEWMSAFEAGIPDKEWIYVHHPAVEADQDSIYDGDYNAADPNEGLYLPSNFHPEGSDDEDDQAPWNPARSYEMHQAQLIYERNHGKWPSRIRLQESIAGPSSSLSRRLPPRRSLLARPSLTASSNEDDNDDEGKPEAGRTYEHYESDASTMGSCKGKGKEQVPNQMHSSGPSAPHSSSRAWRSRPSLGDNMRAYLSLQNLPKPIISLSASSRPNPALGRVYPSTKTLPLLGTHTPATAMAITLSSSPSMDSAAGGGDPPQIPHNLLMEGLCAVQGSSYIPPGSGQDYSSSSKDSSDSDSELEARDDITGSSMRNPAEGGGAATQQPVRAEASSGSAGVEGAAGSEETNSGEEQRDITDSPETILQVYHF
ncbi:hypothetical protein QBC44DRAFT_370057 [Cladorrhinum sp. PSN332]|nr:hypothetical protein QBC44DRAFT_370057 [Cladorrhinum sp. PSN332]